MVIIMSFGKDLFPLTGHFDYFLASGDFGHLLITFANSGSKPYDTLIVFLKEFFEKRLSLKKADDNKGNKNDPACKELNIMTCGIRRQ